jgi:hypothetical protein
LYGWLVLPHMRVLVAAHAAVVLHLGLGLCFRPVIGCHSGSELAGRGRTGDRLSAVFLARWLPHRSLVADLAALNRL